MPSLKNPFLVSLLGHIVLFSMISFTFSSRVQKADYAGVSFLGQLLVESQIKPQGALVTAFGLGKNANRKEIEDINSRLIGSSLGIKKAKEDFGYLYADYLKPKVSLAFNQQKGIIGQSYPSRIFARKREPAIMFYPLLPYTFPIYFKDRQVAHVELEFQIKPQPLKNSIMVKRKISSGNPEVDLLSMRYIKQYLFIKQANFSLNDWHTVKIDLSAKND
jgi:hypothetical protein